MSQKVIHIPLGFAATLTSDAFSAGYYVRTAPGGIRYTPSSLAVSTEVVLGPFNEDRDYLVTSDGNDITCDLEYSGVFTGVDDTDISLLAPKASPTFTGTVTVPNTQITKTVYSSNGAISKSAGLAAITKTSAAAMTLAAPATGTDDGLVLVVTSNTDYAHTITATGLVQDGITGGAKTTITFAAFAGASITLVAYSAKWNVLNLNAVVIS